MELTKAGLMKVTLADYPGKVAATIFTAGCNLRCPYCHNADLVDGHQPSDFYDLEEIFAYLNKRRKVLGGVCITGGEPLLNTNIGSVIEEIQKLGLLVKLDTNGTLPHLLKQVKPDFIAMDVKTSFSKYNSILGGKASDTEQRLLESVKYILESGIDHEFRTTAVPSIVEAEDFSKIAETIQGCRKYTIAKFKPAVTLDPSYKEITPYSDQEMQLFKEIMENAGITTTIRG